MHIKIAFCSALSLSSVGLFVLACSSDPVTGPFGGTAGSSNGLAGGGSASTGLGGSGPTGSGGQAAPGSGGAALSSGGSASLGGNTGQGGSAASGAVGVTAGTAAVGTAGTGGISGTGGAPGSQAGSPGAGSGGASGGTGGRAAGGMGGGAAGGSPAGSVPTPGCGMATTQALNQWVDSMVMSGTANRPYAVRLPTGYDPMRPYPVLMLLHGCTSGTNNLPMDRHTGADAILVRGTGSAANTCWDTGASSPDIVFFDAMVAAVKQRFCTDSSRFFGVGYSSGSWLINQLSCIRPGVLRASGTVAGGNPARQASACVGGRMAHMFVHDLNDMDNVIAGSESARDRLLTLNGCDASAQPMPQEPSPCTRYQGCQSGYPVVWCPTSGKGHDRQDTFAAPAFWNFFKEF